MFKRINIKKDYLLVAGTILLLVISYQRAFKRTMEEWRLNRDYHKQLAVTSDYTVQPGYLKRKEDNLQSILTRYKVDSAIFRSSVISTVSLVASRENVRLLEVPPDDPSYHTAQFFIQKLVFQGDYFSLIKTLHELQRSSGIGMIRSVTLKLPVRGQTTELGKPVLELSFIAAK